MISCSCARLVNILIALFACVPDLLFDGDCSLESQRGITTSTVVDLSTLLHGIQTIPPAIATKATQ